MLLAFTATYARHRIKEACVRQVKRAMVSVSYTGHFAHDNKDPLGALVIMIT